jgi:hypothetical protein
MTTNAFKNTGEASSLPKVYSSGLRVNSSGGISTISDFILSSQGRPNGRRENSIEKSNSECTDGSNFRSGVVNMSTMDRSPKSKSSETNRIGGEGNVRGVVRRSLLATFTGTSVTISVTIANFSEITSKSSGRGYVLSSRKGVTRGSEFRRQSVPVFRGKSKSAELVVVNVCGFDGSGSLQTVRKLIKAVRANSSSDSVAFAQRISCGCKAIRILFTAAAG